VGGLGGGDQLVLKKFEIKPPPPAPRISRKDFVPLKTFQLVSSCEKEAELYINVFLSRHG